MKPALNLLVAIPYCTPDVMETLNSRPEIRFLLDSGAFTAWKKGVNVELNDYLRFVENCEPKPWRYFTLDKIGDAKGTKENFSAILDAGLKPIPIFTRGDDLEEIDFYYEHSDVLALGGLVGTRKNKGFVRGIMEHIGKRQIHMLGFINGDFLSYYRPYSCDSSSFARATRFGIIDVYMGLGRWRRYTRATLLTAPDAETWRVFAEYGEDLDKLRHRSEWTNSGTGKFTVERMSMKAYVRFSLDIEKQLGVRYFLALCCAWQVRYAIDSYDFWTNRIPHS